MITKKTKNIPRIRPSYAEINFANLTYNYNFLKKKINKNTEILSVIKADAYGHGSVEVAKKLSSIGVNYFGVASIEEAIPLRDSGIKNPIMILGSIYPYNSFEYLKKYNLIPTVSSLVLARKLSSYFSKYKKTIKIHIKIDTGMNRIGIMSDNAVSTIDKISKLKYISIEGVFSHIVDFNNKILTKEQILKFSNIKKKLKDYNIKYFHIANSGTFFNYSQSEFNMIRPGVALYGLNSFSKSIKLKPILSLKTKIIYLKKVKADSGISYSHTYKTYRDSIIATVPIGYGDGYNVRLSNAIEGILNKRIVCQVGTICMDMAMFDVTDVPNVKVGSEITLIGASGNRSITVEDIALQCGTINYEVVCNISKRIPRIYRG